MWCAERKATEPCYFYLRRLKKLTYHQIRFRIDQSILCLLYRQLKKSVNPKENNLHKHIFTNVWYVYLSTLFRLETTWTPNYSSYFFCFVVDIEAVIQTFTFVRLVSMFICTTLSLRLTYPPSCQIVIIFTPL